MPEGFSTRTGVASARPRRQLEAAAPLVLGAQVGHGLAALVDDDGGDVGRLVRGGEALEVDASGEARHQITALGEEGEIQRLQQDGDGLGRRLHHAAVLDGEGQRALAPGDALWQREADGAQALVADRAGDARHLALVDAGDGGHLRAGGEAALRALDLDGGGDLVARAVTVAQEDDLRLQARGAVGAHVELALGRGVTVPGIAGAQGVLAAGLAGGDLPGPAPHAVLGGGAARGHHLALGAAHLDGHVRWLAQGGVGEGVQQDAADPHRLVGPVDGLVRGQRGEESL
jgi:hypothetical protein